MREQTFEKLYSLKLHGFAQALEEQFKNPDMSSLSFDDRLAGLVDAQWLWRENRAAATRLRKARLKQPASMEDINYRHQRQLDKSVMRSLASCDWVRQHHNITISGAGSVNYYDNPTITKTISGIGSEVPPRGVRFQTSFCAPVSVVRNSLGCRV